MGAILRHGAKTTFAMLNKSWQSVSRAYCATFEDSSRQAFLDLLVGKHRLPRAPGALEVKRRPCGRLSIAVITWNLHGHAVWESPGCLASLLHSACKSGASEGVDVVICCFQEFLPLTAANVMMQGSGDEVLQAGFETVALQALPEALGERFVKVRGIGMVGLYVGAFVAARLQSSVAGVAADRRAAGLYGNKGGVAVRFEVAKTSVCALSMHLESGQGKVAERAAQFR